MGFKLISRGFRTGVRSISKMATFTESPAKASLCCEESQEGAPPSYAMYEALKDSCHNNASYFQPDDSENGQRLYQGFMTLMDHIDTVWPLVDHVRKVCIVIYKLYFMHMCSDIFIISSMGCNFLLLHYSVN